MCKVVTCSSELTKSDGHASACPGRAEARPSVLIAGAFAAVIPERVTDFSASLGMTQGFTSACGLNDLSRTLGQSFQKRAPVRLRHNAII